MARIEKNPLVDGARGNVGKKYVYKKRGKDTHIALMPVIDKNAVPTVEQEKVRDRFASASLYAKAAMSDSALKKEYQKKTPAGKTAFNIAMRDYLKGPVVKSIDYSTYNGTPGSTIVVVAKDNFRVAVVKLSIRTANGTIVEEGNAVLNPRDLNQWIYTTTQSNATLPGTIITATAFDLPGNKATLEVTI